MNFDAIIAKYIGSNLGGSANTNSAQYFKRMLEENKDSLDINECMTNKMFLYLLYYVDPRQKTILDTFRKSKNLEDITDEEFIDVFNELIAADGQYQYRKDRLTTYFLSFKSEIDKRPLVGANLVLAGFDIVAKTQSVIKDDQEYARFVGRTASYPTKQYIKYLDEDNEKYFIMQDIFRSTQHYSDPTISLSRCRNIELIKNNYHMYLMYCMGYLDVHWDDDIIRMPASYDEIFATDELKKLYNKYINVPLTGTLETDIKRKKFDLVKAKKFISYYKGKLMDNEHEVLSERLNPTSGGYRGLMLTEQTVSHGNSWFNRTETKTGKILVSAYWYTDYVHDFYIPKYAYVLLSLLYLFKKDIVEDVKSALEVMKKSYLYCETTDEWKTKNKSYYGEVLSLSKDMNTEYTKLWSYGGKVSDYILKYDFHEQFTSDEKYVYEDRGRDNHLIHSERNHAPVKELIDGIESLVNIIGNN